MTGYGRGLARSQYVQLELEIRSINHRFLDLFLRMPREIQSLEEIVRERIRKDIARGRIEVTVRLAHQNSSGSTVQFDSALARQYHRYLKDMSEDFGIAAEPILGIVASMPGVFQLTDEVHNEEEVRVLLMEALDDAIQKLLDMRSREAEALQIDLQKRLQICHQLHQRIYQRAPQVLEDYRQQLKHRISEVLKDHDGALNSLFDERVETEIVLYADKSDIHEELVRLKSHLDQLGRLWEQKTPVGRTADFLLQEVNREVNTIGSKSNDVVIAQSVVQLKTELEKMREQVQNIE